MSEQASHQPSGGKRPSSGKDRGNQRDWARISSFGVEFAVTVGLIGGLGFMLDKYFGLLKVFPVFLLLGVLLGMGLGIYRMDYQLKAWLHGQPRNPPSAPGETPQDEHCEDPDA